MPSPAHLLCFGEVLWDLLPRGRFLGGAPLNVAFHATQLGSIGEIVSAVGQDALGDDTLQAVRTAGLDPRTISRHATLPTGTAEAKLDALGQATFHLPQPVAWDDIDPSPVLAGAPPDAVIFGTLALRGTANRVALTRLLDTFPRAWIVCDLNLRPPFDDLAPLLPWLQRAQLLKLNGDEARRLTQRGNDATDWPAMAQEISNRHGGAVVCVTLGADGAGAYVGGQWLQTEAPKVTVRDTIGAGDAFTAALVHGRLNAREGNLSWPGILRDACALGAFVAAHDGAQPPHRR